MRKTCEVFHKPSGLKGDAEGRKGGSSSLHGKGKEGGIFVLVKLQERLTLQRNPNILIDFLSYTRAVKPNVLHPCKKQLLAEEELSIPQLLG